MAGQIYGNAEENRIKGSRMKLEGYAIRLRISRCQSGGKGPDGRVIRYMIHEYKTDNGTFSPETWKEEVMAAITEAGETELFENLKNYCRKHCAWLHKESEVHEYAMEILVSRSYLHWEDFKEYIEIIWM